MDADSKAQTGAALFNQISMNLLSYLEMNEDITSIDFPVVAGVKGHLFNLWDARNAPYKLPNDLRRFYVSFNGLNISWSVQLGKEKSLRIGQLYLNKLEDVKRVSFGSSDLFLQPSFMPCSWMLEDICIDRNYQFAMFVIDSICDVGNIVLLYHHSDTARSPKDTVIPPGLDCPSIWLIDMALQCHFICASFSDYLRLMFSHLGVRGWQQTFTSHGLSPSTKQWMALFCKERLCIDLYNQKAK